MLCLKVVHFDGLYNFVDIVTVLVVIFYLLEVMLGMFVVSKSKSNNVSIFKFSLLAFICFIF